ncbi:tRNA 2-thiocytidine biosynthesis TtcA family protein [Sporosalibacterium faouarense]|uniref:tRNA 2-thiocytidine biosynthesis TtcA family protein n=1 Tax=Sporosalibacterium faouarense TaxID=516123 RepID=UPI00141C7A1E|nr:ATP-binding protein [Sporosalibacterium faouarense]MTI49583.1 tRNA 2-thiocytidine biosynthesis protein TtcA [Bacillota bacterium]
MSNISGSGCDLLIPLSERKSLQEIERSIITTYRKYLWSKFTKAVNEYNLIEDGDKIAVAISGGKDSLLMAKLLQELNKHGKTNFELEFIAMNPGFHESNKELLLDNCNHLNIPVKIFESDIFKVVDHIANDYPCYMCARMRRGALYSKAQELGCNKLALGHHFDDVIETNLINILCSGNFKTMLPKLRAMNFENMELIRPLYFIREEYIKKFTQNNGLSPMNCGCVVAAKKTSSKRREVKELIKELGDKFKNVDINIFQAANNVNMDRILGWKKDGEKHSYLDFYED